MRISVIVCTFNRANVLTPCLDSIAESLSAAAPVEAEIIVVDNASTDNTSAVIKKWAETSPFPVQALHEPKKGLSAARNCALRAARGELLAFTDDDCRMSKNYVIDALRHDAADTEPVFRGGRIELGDSTDLPLSIKTDPDLERMSRKMNSAKKENVGMIMAGCNMVMRRSLANSLGFFDENLGAGTSLPGGEDTDFFFRAYLAGTVLEYVPDMAVTHFHGRKTKLQGYNLLCNYMLGTGALYVKYFFKDINFCRPFYWDIKSAVNEIISGKMDSRAQFGFSYKTKVYYCVLGAFKYCLVLMRHSMRKPVS